MILNWNGWRYTVECLESVQRLTYPRFRIVVIDNGSTDSSVEKITAWANGELTVESHLIDYDPAAKPVHRVSYNAGTAMAGGVTDIEKHVASQPPGRSLVMIQNDENLGFADGNNVGIRYALRGGADFVWLLNNDTVVEPGALGAMVEIVEADPTIGVVGSVIYDAHNPENIQAYGGGYINPRFGFSRHHTRAVTDDELSYITGASMLISRQVLQQVGLLDEKFFMYWEDADYSLRARSAGFALAVAPLSAVLHRESASIKRKSLNFDRYFNRSFVLFFRKHFRRWYVPVACGLALRFAKRLLVFQFKNALAVAQAGCKAWRRSHATSSS